jgi:glycosyltransferase involved in cell wall biosynthesis
MRIAMVAPPWYPVPPQAYGGIELVVALLVEGLVARGHDVTLIANDAAGAGASRAFGSYVAAPSARIGEALPEVVHAAYAGRLLPGLDVDVVHDHSTAGPLTAAARAVPTVVTAHNDVGGEFGRILMYLGDSVVPVAISVAQRRLAPRIPWAATIYNGLDVAAYPFVADKEDFALFLGRMGPQKAPHLAIDAARAAGRRIVLAGKCTEPVEQDYFAAEIEPRLGPDAAWVGEADLPLKMQLLSSAAVMVFPIQWDEPFGMVLLEAMACGTPVVSLARGAAPEVVVDGRTGFVRERLAELPAAIDAAVGLDPHTCRRHVVERFSAQAMVTAYESLYAELVGEPVGRAFASGAP